MPVPLDAYRSLLLYETTQIGLLRRETDFDCHTVIAPPNQADEEEVYHISFTNVHMVPADPVPRLRRVQLHNPEVPQEDADEILEKLAGRIEEESPMPHLHEDHMQAIAEMAVAACQELDEAKAVTIASPFKILAVMGISITTDGYPLVVQHSSLNFAATMSRHVPDRWQEIAFSSMEDVSEDMYRLAYDLEGEHRDLPAFEEWKENLMESVAGSIQEGGDMLTKQCEGYFGYFLADEATMHPAIAKLFKA